MPDAQQLDGTDAWLWGSHINRCDRERRRCEYAWRAAACERCWGGWIAGQDDRFDPIIAAIQIGNDAVIGADQAECGRQAVCGGSDREAARRRHERQLYLKLIARLPDRISGWLKA